MNKDKIYNCTLLLVIISLLTCILLVCFCFISRYITIEKQIRNQFDLSKSDCECRCKNKNIDIKLDNNKVFNKELSQIYYYHDCIWRDEIEHIDSELLHTIKYNGNKEKDPPNVCIFKLNDDSAAIIFRSTKTHLEMIKDIDVKQVNGMHSGIKSIYDDIKSDIYFFLNTTHTEWKNILLFGHSLGGGLVDMLSYDLMCNHPELWSKCIGISSGGPRIFDPMRCDHFSNHEYINRFIKVINVADIVPCMPSTSTTVEGVVSRGKKYFYKSFSNESRIFRFNVVKETQLIESHMSLVYSDMLWESKYTELPVLPIFNDDNRDVIVNIKNV